MLIFNRILDALHNIPHILILHILENPTQSDPLGPVLIDPPPFLLSSKNVKQAEESKNLFSLLSIWDSYHMTWGVTFIGQRGQFEIGLKGSLCVVTGGSC